MLWQKYPMQNPETPTRTVRGQAIVITPEDSVLHTLNATGTFIWDQADGKRTLEAIVQACLQTFDVSEDVVRQEAQEFIKKASERGLMELHDTPMAAGA